MHSGMTNNFLVIARCIFRRSNLPCRMRNLSFILPPVRGGQALLGIPPHSEHCEGWKSENGGQTENLWTRRGDDTQTNHLPEKPFISLSVIARRVLRRSNLLLNGCFFLRNVCPFPFLGGRCGWGVKKRTVIPKCFYWGSSPTNNRQSHQTTVISFTRLSLPAFFLWVIPKCFYWGSSPTNTGQYSREQILIGVPQLIFGQV